MKISHRPFYTDLAWAYDLIIAGPVSRLCDFVEHALRQRQVAPGSRILDAGCGTGNYSVELARRQYVVTGLDVSAELIAQAHEKSRNARLPLTFQVSDMLELPSTPGFDGVLCRGVLNDLTGNASRQQVFVSFAQALRQGGVLLLDVREWYATSLRKLRAPVFARSVETDRGKLTFYSDTQLDYKRKQLVVQERHSIKKDGVETVSDYDFTMRCWTKEELHQNLLDAGFGSIEYFGDYARSTPVYTTDRIVAVATLKYK
jgi:SAM-dependent methyltransferase